MSSLNALIQQVKRLTVSRSLSADVNYKGVIDLHGKFHDAGSPKKAAEWLRAAGFVYSGSAGKWHTRGV